MCFSAGPLTPPLCAGGNQAKGTQASKRPLALKSVRRGAAALFWEPAVRAQGQGPTAQRHLRDLEQDAASLSVYP